MTARTSAPTKRPAKPKASDRARSGGNEGNLVALGDYLESKGKAVLLHGPTGHGKTTLALAQGPRPALVLDADGGLDSISGVPGMDKISVWPPEDGHTYTWEDLDAFRNYCKAGAWKTKWKLIVPDNVTAAQKPIIQAIQEESRDRLTDKAARESFDMELVSKQAWGKIYRRMDQWVRDIRDATRHGAHVIFTAGTREWEDEAAGFTRLSPNLEGQERQQIATHMDAVGYVEVEDDERLLHLAPQGATITKIRLSWTNRHKMPTAITDPNFDKMMNAIMAVEGGNQGTGAKRRKKQAS